jgi:hypothetical protein
MVFQVTPEAIDFCGRFIDCDGPAERDPKAWVAVRGIDSEGLIGGAIACETAVYQGAATEHQRQVTKRATQAIEYQGSTSDEGEPTFEVPNVDMMVRGHVVLGCPRLRRPRDSFGVF